MTEEPTGQQDQTPVPTDNVEPAQTPSEPQLPDKYQGKSVEELAQMHSELEGKLGKQSNELGELRSAVQYQQQYLQNQATQQGQSQGDTGTTKLELNNETFYDKPLESTRQVVQEEIGQALGNFAQYQQRDKENASFEQGYSQAVSKFGNKFNGQEGIVRELVSTWYEGEKRKNPNLRPEILMNDKPWEVALNASQVASGNYQIVPTGMNPTPQPMQPTGTEIPGTTTSTQSSNTPMRLNEEAQAMLKGFKLTEQQERDVVAGRGFKEEE